MQGLLDSIVEWLKGILVDGIMENLYWLFEGVNMQVRDIASQVGRSPATFQPQIFNLIRNLSENVIMPIAGMILTFIACYELIQLIISHNNLANFETWIFFKWIFKTCVAVMLISNTMNICMAIFDVAQHVVNQSSGIILNSVTIDASALAGLRATLEAMGIAELIGVFLQSSIIYTLMGILSTLVFVVVYARMIEIYLMASLAPIPFATFGNREQSMIGQNYVKSLMALGFQGFLIMVCVGIYAVLIRSIVFSSDIIGSLWGAAGYTILLLFTLFKTGSLAKSIFHAH